MASRILDLLGRIDNVPAYKYYVEILGILVGEFTQVTGLDLIRTPHPYKEGGVNYFQHKLPSTITYSDVTMERGVTISPMLWLWSWAGIFNGQVVRTNVSIIMGTVSGNVAKHWDLMSAYPVKYTGPTLNAGSTDTAVESVTVAHNGLLLSPLVGIPMG